MKRRAFLRGAAMALTGPAVAAPAIAQSAPEIKWRMTSSFSKSMETIFGTAQMLCRYVAEATDNKFQIQAYAGRRADAQPPGARRRHQRLGRLRVTRRAFLLRQGPRRSASAAACPSVSTARQQLSWWTFGGGDEIVNAALKKFNAYGIPAGSTGAQMGAWFKKEINTLEDLKGLRLRVGALGGPICSRRVAPRRTILRMPTSMRRWRTGTIDAAEFICPHDDEKLGLPKVAKYNYHPVLVGKRRHGASGRQSREDGMRYPSPTRPSSPGPATRPTPGCWRKYDAVNPPALKRLVAWRSRHQALSAAHPGGLLQGHQRALRRGGGQGRGFQEGVRFRQCVPQGAACPGGRSPTTPTTPLRSASAGDA